MEVLTTCGWVILLPDALHGWRLNEHDDIWARGRTHTTRLVVSFTTWSPGFPSTTRYVCIHRGQCWRHRCESYSVIYRIW